MNILGNRKNKIVWNFNIQMDRLIYVKGVDLAVANKDKNFCHSNRLQRENEKLSELLLFQRTVTIMNC